MAAQFLVAFSSLLVPAALLLLASLWWPHRKTPLLSCVPWFLAAFLFAKTAALFTAPLMQRLSEAPAAQDHGIAIFRLTVAFVFLDALFFFLVAAMIAANAAFLLEKASAPAGPLQRALATLHRFQPWLGGALLGLSVASTAAILWIARLVLK